SIVPSLSVAPDGSALITWSDLGYSPAQGIYRDALGPFLPVPGLATHHAYAVDGAAGPRGDMAVIWGALAGHGGFLPFNEMSRPAGGSWGPSRHPGGLVWQPNYYLPASIA